MKMHEIEAASTHMYSIGCRKRSMLRLLALFTLSISTLGLLYHVLAIFTDSALFVFVLVVILTAIHRAASQNAGMWALFIMKDGAYGSVKKSGITYHAMFRKKFVHWSQIDQLDYSPRSGRITIFIYGRAMPIQFGRCNQATTINSHEPSLLAFLKREIQSSGGTFVEQRSTPWVPSVH
jgi:hypothetical protein